MALWEERIEPSVAWQAVERAREQFSNMHERHPGHGALLRASHLADLAAVRLRGLDPDLAFESLLSDLGARVDTLAGAVVGHLEPPEGVPEQDLGSVEAAADLVAQTIAVLPPAGDDERAAVVDSFRRDLADFHSQLSGQIDKCRSAIGEAATRHTEDLVARDAQAEELKTRLSEMDAKASEIATTFDGFLTEQSSAAAGAATAAKAEHEAQRASAAQEIDSLLSHSKEAFDEETERHRTGYEAQLADQASNAGSALQRIEELKAKAETLVGAVGRTGLSGGYQQWEATERKQADNMRVIAIVFGVLSALAVVAMLVAHEALTDAKADVDIALTISALAVPAALGGVAAYAGKESAHHRRNQVIARRTELELASFGPYLAELERDEQAEITAVFTPVFFGQATAHTSSAHRGTDTEAGPQSLIREVLDRLADIIKARVSKKE